MGEEGRGAEGALLCEERRLQWKGLRYVGDEETHGQTHDGVEHGRGSRFWEGEYSAYEYNKFHFSIALYSLTMSGNRNWERDLINVGAHASVSMSFPIKNVGSLDTDTHATLYKSCYTL